MLKRKQNQELVPTGKVEADANGPSPGAGVPTGPMLLLNAPRDLSPVHPVSKATECLAHGMDPGVLG